jgi:RHS repeat-associated protein
MTKAAGDLEPSFGYTGHWRHTPSELLLAQYRAYDPDTARWLSRDPVAENGGVNLYSYANNQPINNIDPDGLTAGTFEIGLGGYFYPAGGGGGGQLKFGVAFGNTSDGRFPVQLLFGSQGGAGIGEGAAGVINVGGSFLPNPKATIDEHVAGKNVYAEIKGGALWGGSGGISISTEEKPDGTTRLLPEFAAYTFSWGLEAGGGAVAEAGISSSVVTAFGRPAPKTPLFKLSASYDDYRNVVTAKPKPKPRRRHRRRPLRGAVVCNWRPPTVHVDTQVSGQLVSKEVSGQLLTPIKAEPSAAGTQ